MHTDRCLMHRERVGLRYQQHGEHGAGAQSFADAIAALGHVSALSRVRGAEATAIRTRSQRQQYARRLLVSFRAHIRRLFSLLVSFRVHIGRLHVQS